MLCDENFYVWSLYFVLQVDNVCDAFSTRWMLNVERVKVTWWCSRSRFVVGFLGGDRERAWAALSWQGSRIVVASKIGSVDRARKNSIWIWASVLVCLSFGLSICLTRCQMGLCRQIVSMDDSLGEMDIHSSSGWSESRVWLKVERGWAKDIGVDLHSWKCWGRKWD